VDEQALQPETAALVFFEQACILIDEEDRSECGFQGITPGQCQAKGCCYIIAQRPDVPYCFPSSQHAARQGHAGRAAESTKETGSQEQQPQNKTGGDTESETTISGSNAGVGLDRPTPGSSDNSPDAVVVGASDEEGHGTQEKGTGEAEDKSSQGEVQEKGAEGEAENKRNQGEVQELEQHDGQPVEVVVEGDAEKMTVLSTTRRSAARIIEVLSFPTVCLIAIIAFLIGSVAMVVCIGCSRSRNFGGAHGYTQRTSEYQSLRVASQSCNDLDFGGSASSVASAVAQGYARNTSRGLSVSSNREGIENRQPSRTSSRQDPVPRSSSRSSDPWQASIPRSSSRPGNSPQEAGGAWTRIEVQDPI